MSNLSYTRFRNTLKDLQDCADYFLDSDLSHSEHRARLKMLELIKELAQIDPNSLTITTEEE